MNSDKKKHVFIGASTCALCGESESYAILYKSTLRNPHSDFNPEKFSARRIPDETHGTIVKCRKCGLVRTLELIDPHYLSNLYKKSAFTYKNILNNLAKTYREVVIRALEHIPSKDAFLEIGCGNGFLLKEVSSLGFKNVVGIEPSTDAISFADDLVRPLIKNAVFSKNMFSPSSFDMVAGFQVFDHIQDPNTFLSVCKDVLREKGILLLMHHDVNSIPSKILRGRSPIYDIEHPYLYSKETMFNILKKNGFDIIDYYNPASYFSFRYIIRLLPFPEGLKTGIINSRAGIFDFSVKIYPGNLCVIARKNQK